MIRGAIIGFGNVAIHGHLPGWLARGEARIAAVSDLRPAQRAECERRLPGARWYASPDALLDGESLDFVDICTPPSSHAALVRAALDRGLHVLCEKPLVRSLDELAPLARLAQRSRRVLQAVHNWHHAPLVRLADDLVRRGEVGRLRRITWQTLRTQPALAGDGHGDNWRLDPDVAGGGVLSDHGWHVSYLLHRWIGAWPLAVSARLETRRHTRWPVEDTATVSLTFPGAAADVFLTWAADERRNRAVIEGASGRVELLDDTLVLVRNGTEQRWPCAPLSNGSHHPDWFGGVVDGFLAEVTGAVPAGGNLGEAALCATVEHLARESSRRDGATLPVSASAAPPHAASAWR
jgi:predicted dehydrogenase